MNFSDKSKLKFAIKQIIKEELSKDGNVDEGIFGKMAGAIKSALGPKQKPSQPAPEQPAKEQPKSKVSSPYRESGVSTQETGELNFVGQNLSGQNFDKKYLYKPNFTNANLQGASFKETSLANPNFEGANLQGANFKGARFSFVPNFEGANLQDVNFEGVNLVDAKFRGANLGRAKLQNAALLLTNFQGANLEGANLQGALLSNANLKGATYDSETEFPASFPVKFDPEAVGMVKK